MANFISIRNLHLYPLNQDNAEGVKYGEAIKIPGLVKVAINPSTAEGTYYADGIAYESIKKLGEISMTVQTAALDLATTAKICGHDYDEETGVLKCNANDIAPYFGMKYERVKSDGTSRFIALNKVMFKLQNEEGSTATESIEFQDSGDLEATALPTIFDNEWKSMVEPNSNNEEAITNFFKQMIAQD